MLFEARDPVSGKASARSVACSTAAVNRARDLALYCCNRRPAGGIRAGQAQRSERVSPRAASFSEHVLSRVRRKFAAIVCFDAPLNLLSPGRIDVGKRFVDYVAVLSKRGCCGAQLVDANLAPSHPPQHRSRKPLRRSPGKRKEQRRLDHLQLQHHRLARLIPDQIHSRV